MSAITVLALMIPLAVAGAAPPSQTVTQRLQSVAVTNPQPSRNALAAIWADAIGPRNAFVVNKPPQGQNAALSLDVVRFTSTAGDVLLSVNTVSPKCTYDGPMNTDNYPHLCPARVTIIQNGASRTRDVPDLVCTIVGNDGIDPNKIGVFARFDPEHMTIAITAKSDIDGTQMCSKNIAVNQ